MRSSTKAHRAQMPVEHRQTERVQKYAKRWDKDSANDTEEHKQNRLDEYTEVVNGTSESLHLLQQAEEVLGYIGSQDLPV